MYNTNDLYKNTHMAEWSNISLALYKDFAKNCLFDKTFRYFLDNESTIDVEFKEWAMHHLWAIHHIDYKISKKDLFDEIDNGLSFDRLMSSSETKKRLMNYRDRLRMFSCIYTILKNGNLFYVHEGVLEGTRIKVDYLKSSIIDTKGANIGMRFIDGAYVPITLLIDRAINPRKTVEGLRRIRVTKLEIIENDQIIDVIIY